MSIKILLADDSITIQKVVGIIFGGEEYTLTVVDNGKAAVEKAREQNPDVLLIDALMPGMSGYEVCEAVRATPALAAKPILLLTGSFEPFDENKAKSCGADDFLAKPFESQQILTKVKELLDLGATRAGASPPSAQPAAQPVAPPAAPPAVEEPATPAFAEFQIEPDAQPIAEEMAATNDIWGAFTAPDEAPPVVETPVTIEPAADEDMFAMVSEEPAVHTTPAMAATSSSSESTGSMWVPVEEETFEFEEEAAAEPSVSVPVIPAVSAPILTEPEMPAVEKPAPVAFQQTAPAIVPLETATPTTVTEDQLRTVLAGASKEVIERIVWEIV